MVKKNIGGEIPKTPEQVETLPEPTELEVKEPAPKEDEQLRSEVGRLTKELDKAQAEAKAHQRNVSKKDTELQSEKQWREAINEKINILSEMMGKAIDRETEGELEEKPKPKSTEYQERLKQIDEKAQSTSKKQGDDYVYRLAVEADKLARSAGLEVDKSPELREAYVKFLTNDPEGGLEEVKKMVAQKETKPKAEDPETLKAHLKEEIRKEIMAERGELDTETGKSGGGTRVFTRQQIATMSDEDYSKNKADIDAAQRAGNIK